MTPRSVWHSSSMFRSRTRNWDLRASTPCQQTFMTQLLCPAGCDLLRGSTNTYLPSAGQTCSTKTMLTGKLKKTQKNKQTPRELYFTSWLKMEREKNLFVAQFPPLSYGYADPLTVWPNLRGGGLIKAMLEPPSTCSRSLSRQLVANLFLVVSTRATVFT